MTALARGSARKSGKKLQEDDNYTTVRLYDNGKIRVMVRWMGRVEAGAGATFCYFWPMFSIGFWNYGSDERLHPDPLYDGKTFGFEHEAINAYEELLIQWTNSTRSSEGFKEEDNKLAPPPPPDPDAPTTSISTIKGLPDDDVGAW